jgi:uncharacterized protein
MDTSTVHIEGIMEILRVVVGSQLHRLALPDSDTDIKSVYASPLRDLVSPFKGKDKARGQGDETALELRHFCLLATKGNPTILEVLWSDKVLHANTWGWLLQGNRHAFLDAKAVKAAHLGYAKSQAAKLAKHGDDRRRRKHLVAYLRVLQQGLDLLRHGTFNPDFSADRPALHRLLREIRAGEAESFETGEAWVRMLEERLLAQALPRWKSPDYDWIESVVLDIYKETL